MPIIIQPKGNISYFSEIITTVFLNFYSINPLSRVELTATLYYNYAISWLIPEELLEQKK